MRAAAFGPFWEAASSTYALDKVACGAWPQRQAVERARAELASLLPHGLATPGHHLFEIVAGDDALTVGFLWVALEQAHAATQAFIFDLHVLASSRGEGHGLAALRALDAWAGARGVQAIGLHVFAHNRAAQALYARWGAGVTGLNLTRQLGSG